MTKAITVAGLEKSFGRTRALDGLDLEVDQGEVHGFLGPNGAGKSTTIRVLLGLLRADAGTVRVLDRDPWTDAVELHRRLAYVPGDVELWPHLTGGEAIDLLTRLRGGRRGGRGATDRRVRRRRDELTERFDLDPTKKGRSYSKGNRQKVAIVAALASDAELLLLDEPTAGLDPLMEVVFQEVVGEAKAAGRTVLLSSHVLAQVERLADRVSIVRLGRMVESGSLADLRHLARTTIEAETALPPTGLDTLPGVHDLRVDGARVRFTVDGPEVGAAVRKLTEFGVRGLAGRPPTLEELMLRHYDDAARRGGPREGPRDGIASRGRVAAGERVESGGPLDDGPGGGVR
ncbi:MULTISPECIES: ABC transporter ATP-binding protein [unclassified Streptomyces]|uniref:ABC transporter ATP-binding protein n=1 Tax=unclassified Streptomyces TaxID=2593676 RepID=UPI001907F5B3|nr:ABC transporter ATP-binding protein [Streptomyces sp. HSG2]